jgi:hypothetical protein
MNELTTEAGKYVVAKAIWNEGMRGHFIRMFTLTGPQDVEIMVHKIEKEARAKALEEVYGYYIIHLGRLRDKVEAIPSEEHAVMDAVSRAAILELIDRDLEK